MLRKNSPCLWAFISIGALASLLGAMTINAMGAAPDITATIVEKSARTIGFADKLGTTTLPTLDTKSDWAKYGLADLVRKMRITAIRFPGGTIGDNYLWDERRLQRWEGFPTAGQPGKVSDPEWADYMTLVENVRHIPNIHTVVLVPNFDGAFRTGANGWHTTAAAADSGVKEFAGRAKAWAQALRRELGPEYTFIWEMGSETYFGLGTHFDPPLAPVEYAKALNVFYREIKKGDPQSLVAAAGPLEQNGASRKGNPWMYTWTGQRADYSAKDWWDVVTREAGDAFDHATFHNYKSMRLNRGKVDFDKPLRADEIVRRAVDFIQSRAPKKLTFSFTEFNGSDADADQGNLTGVEQVLDISEQMGGYYTGGADLLLYWCFRTTGYLHELVSKKPKSGKLVEHPPFYMMRMWAQYMQQDIHASSSSDERSLYVFATANATGGKYGIFLINRTTSEKTVRLDIPGSSDIASAAGETMYDDGSMDNPITLKLPKGKTPVANNATIVPARIIRSEKKAVVVTLPARSLTALSVDQR